MSFLDRLLALVLAACPLVHGYDVPGFIPDEVLVYKQTVNSSGGAVNLKLHVFRPEGHQSTHLRPAIVFFFGGGWVSGSPTQFHPHCEYLAARGMVAISAEYRVKNQHGTTPQECVKDGKSAIRYLRENATSLGLDPNRIVAAGGSAGGHVAAATGTLTAYDEPGENLAISSKPNALVLFNPVCDNGPTGYGHGTVQNYWQEISPLHNIDANAPPNIVFLGTNDIHIPVATARNFKTLLKAQGVRSDLHLYQDQPHGFFNYEVANDGSGPWYGYRDTVFKMDQFLVSLGYLDAPHAPAEPVTGWVTIFGDANFATGSEASASPVTTEGDDDDDVIAANHPPITLADGDFIRLEGSVSMNAPLSGGNFRIGLFGSDHPVNIAAGTGYVGIWAEAPTSADGKLVAGNGTSQNHPFETASGTILGSVPAAASTVPANTRISFTLTLARNDNHLDLSARFSDGETYDQEQNLLKQSVSNFTFDRVAFLMTGSSNATQATFTNIKITTGRVLVAPDQPPLTAPTAAITYLDAVEGSDGNTFATGGAPADTSWMVVNSTSTNNQSWSKRSGVEGNGDSLFQAMPNGSPAGIPELTTRITSLADGTYDIYAFYWDQVINDTQNWVLSARLGSGALTTFSSPGEPAVNGATTHNVTNAADLNFADPAPQVASSDGLRNLFAVKLGRVTVHEGAAVDIRVGMLLNGSSSNTRTWFDGVGHARVNTFASWISGFDVGGQTSFNDDPDQDGKTNGLEYFLGTNPNLPDCSGFATVALDQGNQTFSFTHPHNPTSLADLAVTYQWSSDLVTFYDDGASDAMGTNVSFSRVPDSPIPGTTTVNATIAGLVVPVRLFSRLRVSPSTP